MLKIVNQLKIKKKFLLKSEGISMFPFLRPGDVVFFKKIKFSTIKTNDLVVIHKGGRVFTHRVLYKGKTYLVSRGDKNINPDGRIYPHQIIGRVYQVKRNGEIFHPETLYLIQSTLYFQEIVKIKKAFERSKINHVFLKGLILNLYFYKKLQRRLYADCDILVAQNDYLKVEKVFSKFGYYKTDTSLSPVHKLLKDKKTEVVFYKKINDLTVRFDIHFEIVFLMIQLDKLNALYPQKLIDELTRQFLIEKQLVKIQNEYFPVLSLSNFILYLALHFFRHNFRLPYTLELLDKIIKSAKSSEFYDISQKISYCRLQNFVYPVFWLLKKYYYVSLPASFFSSIRPNSNIIKFIKANILRINIFNRLRRYDSGVNRFQNIFYLSPNPLIQKLSVFLSLQVIYSIFWVLYRSWASKIYLLHPAFLARKRSDNLFPL